MKIPDNYRQLKFDEIVRKGDLYRCENDRSVQPVKNSIGLAAGSYPSKLYTFWRRCHTKKHVAPSIGSVPSFVRRARALATPTPAPTIKKGSKVVVVVAFNYPSRNNYHMVAREVQVISLDDTYLTGLERTHGDFGKYKYQFKRFRRDRINCDIRLTEFTVS